MFEGLWSLRKPFALGAFMVLVGACTVLDSTEDVAKEARVVVTGTTPVPLELVTSTRFDRTISETGEVSISLALADTVLVDLATPVDRTYPVRPDRGFLVRLRDPSEETAVVSMQVFFDGRLSFDRQNVTLQDASLEFSYMFGGRVPN